MILFGSPFAGSVFSTAQTITSWTPASIANVFSVYVVSPATCFQDTAGTVQCTAAGQTVQRVNDLRGATYGYLVQGTTPHQPLLQQDGSGRWYLQFDGVDDFMTGPFSQTTTWEALMVFEDRSAGTSNQGIDFCIYGTGGANSWMGRYNASPPAPGNGYSFSSAYLAGGVFPIGQISLVDFTVGYLSGSWEEKLQVGSGTASQYITTSANSTGVAAATNIIVGSFNNAFYAAQNLYALVTMGSTLISSSDKTQFLSWSATNCGAV